MAKALDNVSPHYEELKGLAGSALTAGELQTVQESYVFPMVDVASGDNYAGVIYSPKVKAAKAAVAISAGDAVYWITASSTVTTSSSGNTLIGVALESALSGDSHVTIKFDGTLAFAKL
jgi:predicted RecA/RadA family phage recombinase